jgi:hypothetical protein
VKRVAAAVLVAAVSAGCGGDEPLPAISFVEGSAAAPREPGLVALRFVQAASTGDTDRMRALMSADTRTAFGPGAAADVSRQLAGFQGARIVLSRALDERWAVGAVSGRAEDGDPAAWGAALRLENGRWRVELGGVFFTRLRPAPAGEAEPDAEIRVEAQAGGEVDDVRLWLGNRELRVHAFRRQAFTREIWGRLQAELPEGRYTLVAFATSGDTAGALAWPFDVEG